MIFKKLLISLVSLGVIGGTGAGVYYSLKEDKSKKLDLPLIENLIDKKEEEEESDIDVTSRPQDVPNVEISNQNQQRLQEVNTVSDPNNPSSSNSVVEVQAQVNLGIKTAAVSDTSSPLLDSELSDKDDNQDPSLIENVQEEDADDEGKNLKPDELKEDDSAVLTGDTGSQ